jgi:hypothetical protein
MMRLAKWPRLFLRWARVLAGQSYYHQPQCLGKAFRPEELAGYFNDLTAKARWAGHTDEGGIPVNILADGRRVYLATTVVQKALGHWDKWLLTRNDGIGKSSLSFAAGFWPGKTTMGAGRSGPNWAYPSLLHIRR